jgi:polyhydroxybutyrate depolymerase
MQQFRLIFILFALMLMACGGSKSSSGTAVAPGSSTSKKVMLGLRSYILALPAGFEADKEYKLLLAFHGSGGSSADMQQQAEFEKLSTDYILAYPQSEQVEWNEGCACNIAHRLGADDLGFVDQVIADIGNKYRLQPGEVYAAGFSQGGLFTQNLACNRSEVFKAVAIVAAPMSVQLAEDCYPTQPVSVMMVIAKDDGVLPYDGMSHPNFGLIGAESAIRLFAFRNQSLPEPVRRNLSNQVELTAYTNGVEKAELYGINRGGHRWQFSGFNTSAEILRFFAELNQPTLPQGSERIEVAGQGYHVRSLGQDQTGPAIILLAGPNQNYHSDSAWYSLLQPMLAQQYRVHTIDRLGNAWSDVDSELSYQRFAKDLPAIIRTLGEHHIVLVAFASSSISARLLLEQEKPGFTTQGLLLIDPDIPLHQSLANYSGYPVDWYQANLAALLPHLAEGQWTQRTADKLAAERQQAAQLIPEAYQHLMDWQYFDLVQQQRLLVGHQQSRAREIANYVIDLQLYSELELLTSVPVTIIDTDFELAEITKNPDQAARYQQMRAEAAQWGLRQAEISGGRYIAVNQQEHLLMLQQPEQIMWALQQMIE